MAAFGWNSEEPVRAAAWRLARAARTQLKAYPGGREDGGRRRGSWPTRGRTKTKPPGLSWPAGGGRGGAQEDETDNQEVRETCFCVVALCTYEDRITSQK